MLETEGIEFDYEKHVFTLIPSFNPAFTLEGKKGLKMNQIKKTRPTTYTPDFVGSGWILEAKGMRLPDFNIKWKLMQHQYPNFDYYLPRNMKQAKLVIDTINDRHQGLLQKQES